MQQMYMTLYIQMYTDVCTVMYIVVENASTNFSPLYAADIYTDIPINF